LVGPSDLGKIAICPARIPFPTKSSGRGGHRNGSGGNAFTKEGTKLHKYAENWMLRVIEKELIDSPEVWMNELSSEENNRIGRAAKRLVRIVSKKKKPDFEIVYIKPEFKIRNKQISSVNINGDVDLIIELRNTHGEEKRIIVDWKRTMKKRSTKEYDYQLNIYDELVQEERGKQDCVKFLIGVNEESEKKMRRVDDSQLKKLEEIIQNWKGQKTNPSLENCGLNCPRFASESRCEDAELPSLMEIRSNYKRIAFREKNLSINVWNSIATKGVYNHKEWGATLTKSKTENSVFVENIGDEDALCDVEGFATVRTLPEMKKEIELVIKSIIIHS